MARLQKQQIDIAAIIAQRRFGRFHLGVLGLCSLAFFVAGLDAQLMAAAAPFVARTLDLPVSSFVEAAHWTGYGVLLGLLCGGLGDRIGRRRIVMLGLLLCGVPSILSGVASIRLMFQVLQLLTGFGAGLLLPSALALLLEVLPLQNRLPIVGCAWACFAAGSALAKPAANGLLGHYAWSATFVVGGLLPVVVALLMSGLLPESPLFLLLRQGQRAAPQVNALLRRISKRYGGLNAVEYVGVEPAEPGMALLLLFSRGRGRFTALLWLAFFSAMLAATIFASGMEAEIIRARLSAGNAAAAQILGYSAGIVGAVAFVFAAEERDHFLVLAAGLLLGAVSLGLLAIVTSGTFAILAAVPAFFITGGAIALGVFAAVSYPVAVHATGTGWALAAGALGQIVGTVAVPALAASRVPLGGILAVAAVFAAAAAVLAAVMAFVRR